MQPRTQSTLPVEEEEASGNELTKEYGQILGCTVHIKCWMDYKKVELKFMRCVCVLCILDCKPCFQMIRTYQLNVSNYLEDL